MQAVECVHMNTYNKQINVTKNTGCTLAKEVKDFYKQKVRHQKKKSKTLDNRKNLYAPGPVESILGS